MTYGEMKLEYENMKSKFEELTSLYDNMKLAYDDMKIKYDNINQQLSVLNRIKFGSKREFTPFNEQVINKEQCSLFDKTPENNIDETVYKEIIEKTEEITVHKKDKTNKAGIRKSYLKNVEVEIKEYELNKDEKCPECDGELKEVSKEVVRQEIEYVPAKLKITNYVQYTYKCKDCGREESKNDSAKFVKTKLPNPLLTHSFISNSLATEVIYQKYCMGAPLYRQEKYWYDKGLVLPRNMMANWCIKLSEYYFTNIYNLMLKIMKSTNELIHCDETTMQCNKEGDRKASSNSFMWVMCSGELEAVKGVVFSYSQSRSEEKAKNFLEGYHGLLMTDGYAGYNNIPDVVHGECWAHCRRYFYESIPLDKNKKMDTTSAGYKGIVYCNRLFEIEEEIAKLSIPEKEMKRQEKSKPVVDEFFNWVNLMTTEKIIVNAKLKKALGYANNQQKELSVFLNNGRIPLSNNIAERAIRPFAVHRKNWLFADSVAGANANAVIYSLIESAKANNLNVAKYIEMLLKEIPQLENPNDEKALEKYLPWSKELPSEILNVELVEPTADLVSTVS